MKFKPCLKNLIEIETKDDNIIKPVQEKINVFFKNNKTKEV